MSEIKNAEIIGRPMYNKDVTISELEQQLKEANEVIEYYGRDKSNWIAVEYLTKYKVKE